MPENSSRILEGKTCFHCLGPATIEHAPDVYSCLRRVCVLVTEKFVEGSMSSGHTAAMEISLDEYPDIRLP